MAVALFDLSGNPELRTLLGEKMRRQQYNVSRFAQWIAPNYIKNGGGSTADQVVAQGPNGPRWSGAPVETVDAFIQEGRTDMLIPIRAVLDGLPIFGDKALRGKEETAKYGFRPVKINRWRKGYTPPTGYERQKIKQWARQAIFSGSNQLMEWYQNFMPSCILEAILAGYSQEIIAPVVNGGLGQARVSHPNFFVAGSGEVGYAGGRPGTSGYESAVATALDGLTNVASDKMTVAFIRNLVQEAPRKKIRPIVTKNGFPFYPVWIKDAQWNQLRQDPEFVTLAQSLTITDMANSPLGNGAMCYIDGAVIYVDNMLWCAYTNADDGNVTSGKVEYGPRPTAAERAAGHFTGNAISTFDTGNKAVAILCGQSMLSLATGEEMSLKDDDEDYMNWQGLALDMIKSCVRNETYDTLGLISGLSAGDFWENTSSLVGATYSPYALTYV
jgi:hypothetical protein